MRKRQVDSRIGARIAKLRHDRGLSQRELGDAIGVTETTIQHYEHGRAAITTDRLRAIAEALRSTLAALVPEGEESAER